MYYYKHISWHFNPKEKRIIRKQISFISTPDPVHRMPITIAIPGYIRYTGPATKAEFDMAEKAGIFII